MRNLRNFLLSFLLGTPLLASALDATGIWIDPRHPGWGLDIFQQNDIAFATFLTYDASGAPTWLFASNLRSNGVNFDACGSTTLTGTLFRGQWPGFGSPAFPQGGSQAISVGSISINRHTLSGPGCERDTAVVSYTIEGVTGAVPVIKMTWASELPRFVGRYKAGLTFSAPQGTCPDANAYLPAGNQQLVLEVSVHTTPPPQDIPISWTTGDTQLSWSTGATTSCVILGPYSQAGQLGQVSGPMYCGTVGTHAPRIGTAVVSDISVSDSGFAGAIGLTSADGCVSRGTLAGAKLP